MPTNAELLKGIQDLDGLMKSQITQGENSSVTEFAGSDHTDQNIPTPAPNGTDYKSTKEIAHKSAADMSTEELENYLAMRKSGKPNIQAAICEIEKLEGVTKSTCGSCGGYGCGTCGSVGVSFTYASDEVGKSAMAIANKYFCGNDQQSLDAMNKAQNCQEGGAMDEADPTPTKIEPVVPVKTDDTGVMVGKGMGEEEEEEVAEMGDMDKSVLSGLRICMKGIKSLLVRQGELEQLVHAQAGLTQTVAKSINSQTLAPTQPQAAHAPRSAGAPGSGLNIQPLSKGMPPNGDDLGGGAGVTHQQSGEQQYSRDEWRDLTKSAGQMIYQGLLDPMTVVRMESNVTPDEATMQAIHSFRKNGQVQQQQPAGPWV